MSLRSLRLGKLDKVLTINVLLLSSLMFIERIFIEFLLLLIIFNISSKKQQFTSNLYKEFSGIIL